MEIASGRVVDGRVELDSDLPEGTAVTVLAREGDGIFEADPETERMILTAIAPCEHSRTGASLKSFCAAFSGSSVAGMSVS